MTTESLASLPSVRRQHLLTEFAGLKHACPEGVFVSLTPGDPSLWSAAVFIREGPYKTAVLRFQICFPDAYPLLPPLVTFSTDLFHPLIAPLTTFMYTTDIQDNGTVSATDAERLPPGGFSLRHGFPEWFGRKSRMGQEAEPSASKVSSPKSDASSGYMSTSKRSIAVYDVLKYIRSTFTEDKVLDDIPLAAAGNPGAWHAWRAHRRKPGKTREPVEDSREIQESAAAAAPAADADADANTDADATAFDAADNTNAEAKDNETANTDATNTSATDASDSTSLKQPGEWNWEGVWEDRVKKGIAMSLSEPVLYGGSTATEELIRFLPLEEADIESIKENVRRILGEPV